jgi:inner membrane protein
MYVLGHVGISLLLYAPIVAGLLSTKPLLAVLTGILMVGLAPLPDLDTRTQRVDHRGPTHTIWFALGVGLLVALVAGVGTVVLGTITGGDSFGGLRLTPLWMAGWFGGVSTLTICGHLVGDLVTPMGIWPFRPLSDWHHTFDLTPSKSPRANQFCFGAGMVAVVSTLLVVIL